MNRAKSWIIVDEANQLVKDGEFAKLLDNIITADIVAEADAPFKLPDFAALEERVLNAMRNDPQAYQDTYPYNCGLKPMQEDAVVQATLSQVEKTTGQKSTLVIVGPGVSSDTLMALRRAGLEVRDSLDEPRVQEVGFPLKHAGGGKSKGPRNKWGKVK